MQAHPQPRSGLSRLLRALGFGGPLSKKQIAKSGQLAANAFAQPEVRMREMQRLIKDGQQSALSAVLKRFAINAQGHIADEEEKRWLEEALVELGEPAKTALERFIEQEDRLTYALTAYAKLTGNAAAASFFVAVLRAIGPEDHRRIEAKQQLLLALAPNLGDKSVQAALASHLLDHADDVAIAALALVETVCRTVPAAETATAALSAPLTRLVTDAQTSARLAQRAADIWVQAAPDWLRLEGERACLAPSLQAAYAIESGRLVPRAQTLLPSPAATAPAGRHVAG